MIVDSYAHEDLRLLCLLEREPEADESDSALADIALSAAEVFGAGWLAPLAWELLVACRDADFYTDVNRVPPQAHWLLRLEQVPAGIRIEPLYTAQVIETLPTLDSSSLCAWVDKALKQDCPGGSQFTPAWSSVWSRAMRVKLPDAQRFIGRASVAVEYHGGHASVPLERTGSDVWVSGPRTDSFMGPPGELHITNSDGFLTLALEGSWSLWIDDPAGREQVDAAVERVLALDRGWRRSEG